MPLCLCIPIVALGAGITSAGSEGTKEQKRAPATQAGRSRPENAPFPKNRRERNDMNICLMTETRQKEMMAAASPCHEKVYARPFGGRPSLQRL